MFDLNTYQALAGRTANPMLGLSMRKAVAALGLAGESGEVCDLVKKEVGHNHPPDFDKIKDEASDILWYLAEIATAYGLTLNGIAEHNVAKLRKRYPEGFSSERSINRAE